MHSGSVPILALATTLLIHTVAMESARASICTKVLNPDNFPHSAEVFYYFSNKHEELLANDYHDACSLIAFEMAGHLIDAGESPTVVVFSEKVHTAHFIHTKTLLPLPFQGRVTWGAHVVAVSEGMVYDPALTEPVLLSEYSQRMFGESISWKEHFSTEDIRKTLGKK
jgi:hypothetical protein